MHTTYKPTYVLTHSFSLILTCAPTYSFIHALTHLLTHSLTHSLTYSLTLVKVDWDEIVGCYSRSLQVRV